MSKLPPRTFQQTPGEDYAIGLTYTTDKLPVGKTIASGTATAVQESTGLDASAALLGANPQTLVITASGLRWETPMAVGGGGVDGEDYLITALLTLTGGGETLVDCITLRIRACTV